MGEVFAGAEAWSSDAGDVGVLVLHGFTGNPVSLRPLAEAMARAGHAVELPRLPGHGTSWEDLQTRTWPEWADEASAALDRLVGRTRAVVVAGLSMGATLGLHLAQSRSGDVTGLALVNPSVHSSDVRLKALPVLKRVVPSLPGIGNDIAKPGGDEQPYSRIPLRALHSFRQLQARVHDRLPVVTAPTVVFSSRTDHVVEPENSITVYERIRSTDRELVHLERSFHVATLDHDAELIEERTAAFVARVTAV